MMWQTYLLCFFAAVSAYETYEGFRVLQVVPSTETQLRDLVALANDDKFIQMYQLDFWKEPTVLNKPVHVMVSPESEDSVTRLFASLDMDVTIYIDDIDARLEAERVALQSRPDSFEFDYDNWNTFEEYMEELSALQEDCPDGYTCDVFDIGETGEGRPMRVFKISKPGSGRRAYWVDSLIHAREWIAGATGMRILNTMVRNPDGDSAVDGLLDAYDWYFLPVMNPDGFSYTHTNDRLWRKNRSENPGSACLGTDLNRNYEYLWGGVGSSDLPCSTTFAGVSAASELETQAVQAYLPQIADSLEAWVSLHSYSQFWLIPWGDSDGRNCVIADDDEEMMVVANAAADASEAAVGDTWARGNWCEVLYASTGILQDHVKAVGGVKFTFTPELRDDGAGFAPPPSSIEPSYQEVWSGVKAMVSAIEEAASRQ